MKTKRLFRFYRRIVALFMRKYRTEWDVPYDGSPAVFCPNHERGSGPVIMSCLFELWDNTQTWYSAVTVDRKALPNYVRIDHWWDHNSKLHWLYNITVPYLAALVLPHIMKTIPGIPVYYDKEVTRTFKLSTEALGRGENVTIFAQEVNGYKSHEKQLRKGFLLIAPLAWKRCGIRLKFYPVHISKKEHLIRVLAPVEYDPDIPFQQQEDALAEKIGAGVWDE